MIARLSIILVAGIALGACKTIEGSVAGSESKVFEAPEYAVKGKTQYDQDWIDGNVEAGIAGFGWPRPKPRPPELDAAPALRVPVTPKKKPSLAQRIKARVMGAPPVPMTAIEPLRMPMMPVPPVTVPPVDPVDELLGIKR